MDFSYNMIDEVREYTEDTLTTMVCDLVINITTNLSINAVINNIRNSDVINISKLLEENLEVASFSKSGTSIFIISAKNVSYDKIATILVESTTHFKSANMFIEVESVSLLDRDSKEEMMDTESQLLVLRFKSSIDTLMIQKLNYFKGIFVNHQLKTKDYFEDVNSMIYEIIAIKDFLEIEEYIPTVTLH